MGRTSDTFTAELVRQYAVAFRERHGYAATIRELADMTGLTRFRTHHYAALLPAGMVSYSGRSKSAVTR